MFLQLNHQKLEVYSASKEFVLQCYRISKFLPDEERYNVITQIRRAALSVHLNIAEGCSRKSETERKRYYEIARGSLIEIDAALDIANALNYFKKIDLSTIGEKMIRCFKLLTGLLN
jgi:four helix bundle protein